MLASTFGRQECVTDCDGKSSVGTKTTMRHGDRTLTKVLYMSELAIANGRGSIGVVKLLDKSASHSSMLVKHSGRTLVPI